MDFFLGKMLTVFVFIFFANIYVNEGYNTSSTCQPPPKCCKSYHSNQSNQTVCTGMFYDETREECLPGYFGPSCSLTCRYPNYGKGCQSECVCAAGESCNHIRGCEQKTCPKGYVGPSCNSTCQFPSYGAECRLKCSCEWQHCNSITGCTTSVQNETYWTTYLPLNTSAINTMHVSNERKTSKKDVMDGTTAEDQSDVTQNSTKYDQYSNKSTEKGPDVILDCSSVRPYISRPFQNSTMLIILCFLTSAFFVIIVMYFRLNKRPTTCLWR